jgi:hypothetical protein
MQQWVVLRESVAGELPMAMNEQHLKIRKFYVEAVKQHCSEGGYDSPGILDFQPKKYEIGGAWLSYDEKDPERPLIDEPLESRIDCSQPVPANVLSAFERHRCYAQQSLSTIAVYRIPVNQVITFAICIHGFVDDGWDNYGDWIEIYDREGVLVGSALIPTEYEWQLWEWLNRPLQGDDFNSPATEREEAVTNMLRAGKEINAIAARTGLSIEEIQQLQQQQTTQSYSHAQEVALEMLGKGAAHDIIALVTRLSIEEIQQLQQQQ